MFDTLDQQIDRTQGAIPTQGERLIRYLVVGVLSVVLFGSLLLGILLLEF
jgi:hypothetical protein